MIIKVEMNRKAKQSCTFNYSLQDLAMKHGGSETNDHSWIQKILKDINNNEIKDDKDLEALVRLKNKLIVILINNGFIS